MSPVRLNCGIIVQVVDGGESPCVWHHDPHHLETHTPMTATRNKKYKKQNRFPPHRCTSLPHLLARFQLLLQLTVLIVPHQIVDRIPTLLRSFLCRNHPRIIVCHVPALHFGLWTNTLVVNLLYLIDPRILHPAVMPKGVC